MVFSVIQRIRKLTQAHGRYISNLGATFISQGVSALSVLLLTPQLVKQLGAGQYSIYGVLLNLVVFSSIFDFGLNIGLLRRIIHQRDASQALINAMVFFFAGIFLLSIPLFYGLFAGGVVKAGGQQGWTALVVALVVMQNILAVLFDVIIQSANKIFVGKMIRVVRTCLEFGLLWRLSRLGSVQVLLLGTISVNFIYLAALFIYSRKEVHYRFSWQYFRWPVLQEHLKYSFWYFQSALATVLVYNAQIIMIGHFVDALSVTKYLLVVKFYEVVGTGLANFTIVLFPSLSGLQAEGNWKKLRSNFLLVTMRVGIMVVIMIALALTIGERAFIWWGKYSDPLTLQLFRWYSVFIGLLVIEHVPTVFLSALKFNRLPAIVATVQGVLGLLLSYFLLPVYGVMGALAASLIAFLCTNFFFNPLYLYRNISTHL